MIRGEVIAAIALTLLSTTCGWGRGENWMPTEESYRAAEGGKDCSVLRGIKLQQEERLTQSRHAKAQGITELKERRGELEKCAEKRGLKLGEGKGVGDEALLAEVCPANYEEWLRPGYHLQFIKQEIQEAKQAIDLLDAHLKSSCRPLRLSPPTVVAPVEEEEKVAILPEDLY